MDFALTEEHLMVQKMVRDFVQKEVTPVIKEYDRKQEMPPFILPRMAALGILGINLPVRYGGQGMDYISLGLVCEELEAVDWYQQRADAVTDENLKGILLHNMNEELEHASMLLEWIRQHNPQFSKELKEHLFSDSQDIAKMDK